MMVPDRVRPAFLPLLALLAIWMVCSWPAAPAAGADALPAARSWTQNSLLRAVPAPAEVEIDGRLDDWDRTGRIFMCADLTRQRDRQSAYAMAMYDDQALYLAMDVRDPTPLGNTVDPAEQPEEGWRDDCLQVRLRFPAPAEADGAAERIYWLDSWYYRPGARPVLQLQQRTPVERRVDAMAHGAAAFRAHEDGKGYVQELRLPWALLGVDAAEVRPDFSFRMGLELTGGEAGDAREAFRITDLVAELGTSLELFYTRPQAWGRTELMAQGGLEVATPPTLPATIAAHPFLICTRAQFAELRERAAREPWKTMAEDALARAAAGEAPRNPAPLQQYLGAVALAYILEPDQAQAHAHRVRDAITGALAAVDFNESMAWVGVVPQMGAAFLAILSLDIVYDDLTPEEIAACEAVIQEQINKINRRGSWPAARYGTHGTWDIYKGARLLPDDAFYENYLRQMTDDGVSTVSPGYAFARLGSDHARPQKTAYADVLEFTGIDRRYYNHPRLAKFYRWLFSASINPAREYHLFNDVSPTWQPPNSPLLWRVGRFDRQAAAYAAWFLQGKRPPGHLLSYVLMREPLPDPVVPRSQLFNDGGAVFRELPDAPQSLAAALYNITERDEWHTHRETNAISISAYGNRLLVNGGWLGEERRPAAMNNTLAINGEDHARRLGAGLVEGLLADTFDYAAGHSGRALDHGAFTRSLILVHSQGGCGGYFIVFDEVEADPGDKIHVYLQTASTTEPAAVAAHEYVVEVNHHAKVEGVKLAVLYAGEPERVMHEMIDSGFLERIPEAGRHYRQEVIFGTDPQGNRRLVTVLFPHDPAHPKAQLSRIAGDGYTGATVGLGHGVTDFVAESDGEQRVTAGNLTFRARAVVHRLHDDDGEAFYFARAGRELRHGSRGFTSDQPVSIFMKGGHGRITSRRGGEVTLHHPGVTGVQVSGEAVEGTQTGDGWVRFTLPTGDHEVTLLFGD